MTVTNPKADYIHPQYHNDFCLLADDCNTKSKNYYI